MSDVAVQSKRPAASWGWFLGLALLTLAVFAPSIGFDYVDLDDPQYVFANPHVVSGLTADNVRWAFTHAHESWWLPALWMSYMANASLLGVEPWGFHLVNVLLHVANALLLFGVLRRATGATRASAFAAALFAIHPLRVESVAWITERKDALSGLFWMLALAVHLRQAEKPAAGKMILLALWMALGLMAKASVVALPAALLLLDYWPLGRLATRAGWKKCLTEKIPLFALAAAFAIITLTTHVGGGGQASAVGGWQRASLVPGNYFPYLAKFFWPTGLSIYYPEHDAVHWGTFALAAGGLLAITGACWRFRRRAPGVLMGWLWFLIVSLPIIRGVRIGIADYANRFIYLPSIGLAIALAWGFAAGLSSRTAGRRQLLGGLAALALAACAISTVHNLRFWRSSEALFQRAWELDPTNYLGITGRGVALQKAERWEEARALFAQAAAEAPGVVRYRVNLALALVNMGRLPEAFALLEEARRGTPNEPELAYALGLAHLQAGQPDQARHFLAQAAPGLKNLESICRSELACACFEDGDPRAANAELQRADGGATVAARTYADLLPYYAWVWDSGERPRALRYFRKLAAASADDPAILNNLAWLLAASQRSPAPPQEALALARRAVELGGEQPILLDTLAAACANAGLYAEAVDQATRARALATAQGQEKLARRLERRIEQYRQNKPWREKKVS
ncbi:MAG TPA: tetratricopeptide repeat protein [Kiritimatiellia bacterium]|nr:tetratricopeptide repeat protein [Kiritimatiellia bacterium]